MVRFLLGKDDGPWQRVIDWFRGQGGEEKPLQKPSPRKLRLFACACFAPLVDLIQDERSHKAVELSENFADGNATEEDLRIANGDGLDAVDALKPFAAELNSPAFATGPAKGPVWYWVARAASAASFADAGEAAEATQTAVEHAAIEWAAHDNDIVQIAALTGAARRATLLRDIFGNPFRPIAIEGFLLLPSAVRMAQAIYDERAFERMPVLADMLEESGVTQMAVLEHLRSEGVHGRGCFALDAVLGKE
jgi:hypothetical protein